MAGLAALRSTRQSAQELAQNFTLKGSPSPPLHPKRKILENLTRESVAAYTIASGDADKEDSAYVQEALFCEPFTYWDWEGLTREAWDKSSDSNKQRLLWERERGLEVKGAWHVYTPGRLRWEAFKASLGDNSLNRKYVRRIAISHWMSLDDLRWVAKELPSLEALDLGNIRDTEESWMNEEGETGRLGAFPDWALIKSALGSTLLDRLTWLGVRDSDGPQSTSNALSMIAKGCTGLSKLSLRGQYAPDPAAAGEYDHHACRFITGIIDNLPDTVKEVELRLSIPFLKLFLWHLGQKTNVQRIGIDLGAWVQVYPLRSIPVDESADRERFQSTFYRDRGGSNLALYPPESPPKHTTHPDCPLFPVRPEDELPADIQGQNRSDILGQMLANVYEAGTAMWNPVKIASIPAEQQARSGGLVHPLALIQSAEEVARNVREMRPYIATTTIQKVSTVYTWFRHTFSWEPVFDWDWFMRPEKMGHTLDNAYAKRILSDGRCLQRIEAEFHSLRDAKIPVHIFIGRRDVRGSSLYWGWPHDREEWDQWLDRRFDACLTNIAGLVDRLSIFYDLRNPLSTARLREIDQVQLYQSPSATCPYSVCPWMDEGRHCPYQHQRRPQQQRTRSFARRPQKMANKQTLNPRAHIQRSYQRLAAGFANAPPTGENADEHPSDNSDGESAPNLHHYARRTAFTREALGWQRFWSEYSLEFTGLSVLRVRMPRCLDSIGSWRLARLLNTKLGWNMIINTDERQHIQTQEDLLPTIEGFNDVYRHEPQEKIWPAGRFVRRTWIWPMDSTWWEEAPITVRKDGTLPRRNYELVRHRFLYRADRNFTATDYEDTAEGEAQQQEEALGIAERAATRERDLENALTVTTSPKPIAASTPRKQSGVFRADRSLTVAELAILITEKQQRLKELHEEQDDYQPAIDGPDPYLEQLRNNIRQTDARLHDLERQRSEMLSPPLHFMPRESTTASYRLADYLVPSSAPSIESSAPIPTSPKNRKRSKADQPEPPTSPKKRRSETRPAAMQEVVTEVETTLQEVTTTAPPPETSVDDAIDRALATLARKSNSRPFDTSIPGLTPAIPSIPVQSTSAIAEAQALPEELAPSVSKRRSTASSKASKTGKVSPTKTKGKQRSARPEPGSETAALPVEFTVPFMPPATTNIEASALGVGPPVLVIDPEASAPKIATSGTTERTVKALAKRKTTATEADAVTHAKTARKRSKKEDTKYVGKAPEEDDEGDLSDSEPEDEDGERKKRGRKHDDNKKFKPTSSNEDEEYPGDDQAKKGEGAKKGKGGKRAAKTAATARGGRKKAEDKGQGGDTAAPIPQKAARKKEASAKEEIQSPVARRTRAAVKAKEQKKRETG
ncbi:hypothetical protein EJ04DRAFT_178378 [Polyplosphaeria fusca]|uniref:Uncharacterized protein n=1 Tax=Polyplosphaeria fusca TaxID=682080 RepID=A0A9P4V2U3_9PLEO|nr:hypothetical protein EJ04DRAFT_178378 [Polyplosphaeria fusca]